MFTPSYRLRPLREPNHMNPCWSWVMLIMFECDTGTLSLSNEKFSLNVGRFTTIMIKKESNVRNVNFIGMIIFKLFRAWIRQTYSKIPYFQLSSLILNAYRSISPVLLTNSPFRGWVYWNNSLIHKSHIFN